MGWLDATACLSTIWERSGQPEKRWRGKKASVWRALLTASTWSNWKTDRFFTANLVWMLNIAHYISVLFWIYSMSESLESAETALFTRLLLLALFTAAAFGHLPLLLLPSDRRSLWPSARCHTIKSEVGRLVQRLMPWLGRLMNGMTLSKPFIWRLTLIYLAHSHNSFLWGNWNHFYSVFSKTYCNDIYLTNKHVHSFNKSSRHKGLLGYRLDMSA